MPGRCLHLYVDFICLLIAQDGVNGVLGSAGPNLFRTSDFSAVSGSMQFDTADVANMIANGSYEDVILHEMAVSFFSLCISRMQNLTNRAHYYTHIVSLNAACDRNRNSLG